MKGTKIALAAAIAVINSGMVSADIYDMTPVEDEDLRGYTGQAGLTIDLEVKHTVGEFSYTDAGSLFMTNVSFGANKKENGWDGSRFTDPTSEAARQGLIDNIRITLDIAGDGSTDKNILTGSSDNAFDTGFSSVRDLALLHAAHAATSLNGDTLKFAQAALGSSSITNVKDAVGLADNANGGPVGQQEDSITIQDKQEYSNGDLLLHISFKDPWQKTHLKGGLFSREEKNVGGAKQIASGNLGRMSFTEVLSAGLKAADFNFSMDAVGLEDSSFTPGDSMAVEYDHTSTGKDGDASTTVLISNLSMDGYLGPNDIHVENNGNGFNMEGVDTDGSSFEGYGKANSKINWNSFINVTNLDVYLDFAGIQIKGMTINNKYGDVTDLDGNFAFGFAQSRRKIYAVKDTANLDTTKLALMSISSPSTVKGVLDRAGQDGVAIDTEFKGDVMVEHLSFGDTDKSIGGLALIDIESTVKRTISAH